VPCKNGIERKPILKPANYCLTYFLQKKQKYIGYQSSYEANEKLEELSLYIIALNKKVIARSCSG